MKFNLPILFLSSVFVCGFLVLPVVSVQLQISLDGGQVLTTPIFNRQVVQNMALDGFMEIHNEIHNEIKESPALLNQEIGEKYSETFREKFFPLLIEKCVFLGAISDLASFRHNNDLETLAKSPEKWKEACDHIFKELNYDSRRITTDFNSMTYNLAGFRERRGNWVFDPTSAFTIRQYGIYRIKAGVFL